VFDRGACNRFGQKAPLGLLVGIPTRAPAPASKFEPAVVLSGSQSGEPTDIPGGDEGPLEMGDDEIAEVQPSAERESMGHHDTGGGNRQAPDATSDVDKPGSQNSGAANTRDDGAGR
jgi:hypothetical protein